MRQGAQHLARVLKVAAPQERRALARQSVRLIGGRVVIDDDDALRRRRTAFGEPARGARRSALGPVKDGGHLHR